MMRPEGGRSCPERRRDASGQSARPSCRLPGQGRAPRVILHDTACVDTKSICARARCAIGVNQFGRVGEPRGGSASSKHASII